jgi:uncharacterized membrane protein
MRTTTETKHQTRDTAILNADRYDFLKTNVGPIERGVSALVGGSLVGLAIYKRSFPTGLIAALVGVPLVARGALGHCTLYQALGINTAARPGARTRPDVLHGINVVKSIVVDRSVDECYSFWLDFEKFPHFMEHLDSVTITGENTSHWIACAPFGQTIEWDAEIVKTEKNHLIEWRSLEGSEVFHAGSVRFEPVDDGQKCRVTVTLRWEPPAGIAGYAIAKIFGEEPSQQVEDDLCRFKEVLEGGQVSSPS